MSNELSRIESILEGDMTVVPQSRVEVLIKELVEKSGGPDEKTIKDIVDREIASVVGGAPEQFDTLKELSDWIALHESQYEAILSLANGKQDALTFDTTPVEQSANPVTSAGIKAVTEQLSQRISALETDLAGIEDVGF